MAKPEEHLRMSNWYYTKAKSNLRAFFSKENPVVFYVQDYARSLE